MKKCAKCKEYKDIDFFNHSKLNKDGLQSWCKNCASLATKSWYKKNRNKMLSSMKKYGKDNRKELNNYYVEYNKDPDHKRKKAEINASWYQRNREDIRKRQNEKNRIKRENKVNEPN